jgi:hypothetical protein
MSVNLEELRQYQTRELEQINLGTNGRQPLATKTIEWSLVEIAILLKEIREGLNLPRS